MKKSLIIVLGIVLFISCKKEELASKTSIPDVINKSAVSQIINMTESDQKTAYRLLNNHEKAYLWNNKFLNFKSNELLNKEQENFVNDLIALIKPDLFVVDSKSNIEFRTTLVKKISATAKKLFGTGNAQNLLASISSNGRGTITPNLVGDGGELNKCKCSTESNYCDPLAPCDEQTDSVCKHTTFGCGALLLFSCNGKCRPVGGGS